MDGVRAGKAVVLFESKRFRVIAQEMEFPNGSAETWEYIEQKGFGGVRIIALTEENELILVREYRGAAGRYILRLPTGAFKSGDESSVSATQRELEEETGHRAETVEVIYEQKTTGGYFKAGTAYGCLATGLVKTEPKRDAGEQDMEVILVPLEEAYRMVEDCEIENEGAVYAILQLKKYGKHKSKLFCFPRYPRQ